MDFRMSIETNVRDKVSKVSFLLNSKITMFSAFLFHKNTLGNKVEL